MFLGRSSWLIVFGVLVTSAFTIPSFSQSCPRPTAPARPSFIDIPYSYGGHDFVLKSINGSVHMIYEHGGPVGVVGSGDPRRMAGALISAVRHDDDWQWTQEQCLTLLKASATEVRCPLTLGGHL
jgi:hypothetical protein